MIDDLSTLSMESIAVSCYDLGDFIDNFDIVNDDQELVNFYIEKYLLENIKLTVNGKKEEFKVDQRFSEYITGWTNGVLSNQSDIVVELKDPLTSNQITDIEGKDLFYFSPKVKGKVSWVNNKTIVFSPEEDLKNGELYKSEFYINKLLDVPSDMSTFKFQFKIKKMDLEVNVDGIEAYGSDLEWQKVVGSISTSDYVSDNDLEMILTASQSSKNLKINWILEKNQIIINSKDRSHKNLSESTLYKF